MYMEQEKTPPHIISPSKHFELCDFLMLEVTFVRVMSLQISIMGENVSKITLQ